MVGECSSSVTDSNKMSTFQNLYLDENLYIYYIVGSIQREPPPAPIEVTCNPVACPGIRKGGGGRKFEMLFFSLFFLLIFKGGGAHAAQKIADEIIFPTKK